MKIIRKLYNWVLHWAETPYGAWALFLLAFAESSFFPIPPDVLLMPLCLGEKRKSFFFAFISTLGSVFGGLFGYFIGMKFYDTIGVKIIDFYGLTQQYEKVKMLYENYAFWAVFAAGFTPIPYKVFTIAAGVFNIAVFPFVIASILSRGLRFFIIATLFFFFGENIKTFIDKYFNQLSILFVILLIGGFILIKWIMK